jgi:hypothetical protein
MLCTHVSILEIQLEDLIYVHGLETISKKYMTVLVRQQRLTDEDDNALEKMKYKLLI